MGGNYPDGTSVADFYEYGEQERRRDAKIRHDLCLDDDEPIGDSMYDSWRDYEFDRALDALEGGE